ncbi:hypothetical protein MDA_GLEAN10023408 [Myotis davidii]|uniref:Uncharacterized protein n=1 Tax=Myotis davidii TaxID=225400 RepID=L5MBF6_MYODS|nr:hypothetical protein MDA_GLEAN10023408 [Myotis davidii]
MGLGGSKHSDRAAAVCSFGKTSLEAAGTLGPAAASAGPRTEHCLCHQASQDTEEADCETPGLPQPPPVVGITVTHLTRGLPAASDEMKNRLPANMTTRSKTFAIWQKGDSSRH